MQPEAFDRVRRKNDCAQAPGPPERQNSISLPSLPSIGTKGRKNAITGAGGSTKNQFEMDGTTMVHEVGEFSFAVQLQESNTVQVEFCTISARGGMSKPNQDSAAVMHGDHKDASFGRSVFAVCDGHGPLGHQVSAIVAKGMTAGVKQRVDVHLKQMLLRVEAYLIQAQPEVASLSGSTCCAVELGADGVTCANAGDSRALLLSKQEEEWTCQPLSSDHNVQNLSESRRLAAAGVQPDRHGRIWNRDRSMGWNFTQSLGDTIGKQCGICCQPEVKVVDWNQLADDGGQHYIVIASDGLWEFVPNQEVMETVAQGGSLSAICQKLAVEARRRWRNFDPTHIDDTTLTLIKLHVAPLGQGYNLLL